MLLCDVMQYARPSDALDRVKIQGKLTGWRLCQADKLPCH